MKNGKASGEDDISIEIIKKMGNTGLKWMLEVINLAWRNKQVPKDWAKAVICPIHKKGVKTDCENYRGMSLLSHTGKSYERILEKRLRNIVEHKIKES